MHLIKLICHMKLSVHLITIIQFIPSTFMDVKHPEQGPLYSIRLCTFNLQKAISQRCKGVVLSVNLVLNFSKFGIARDSGIECCRNFSTKFSPSVGCGSNLHLNCFVSSQSRMYTNLSINIVLHLKLYCDIGFRFLHSIQLMDE